MTEKNKSLELAWSRACEIVRAHVPEDMVGIGEDFLIHGIPRMAKRIREYENLIMEMKAYVPHPANIEHSDTSLYFESLHREIEKVECNIKRREENIAEQKATCGQCDKWRRLYVNGAGMCTAHVPEWACEMIDNCEFVKRINSIEFDSPLAEECSLFNPVKEG